jgi:hypothetical protein
MENEAILRKQLVTLLTGSEAHVNFDAAIDGLPPDLRGVIPTGAEHSVWELVEHLRIALWDIVEFSREAGHVSPEWPSGYWPAAAAPADDAAWEASVEGFRHWLKEMCAFVNDETTDLYAPIPHGDGQTVLREAMLAADHNAYHVGQIVLVRRLLEAWG